MLRCEARIPTDRAQRYLEQLCSHLGQMQHMRHLPASGHGGSGMPRVEGIEQAPGSAVIRFAEGAWMLEAGAEALGLRIEAQDPAALERLKSAIAARIGKIGRRDGLMVEWRASEEFRAPGLTLGLAGGSAVGSGSRGLSTRRWRAAGWFAMAGIAVAIHLGLIGSLLASGRWKDGAADVILAVIAIKLVLLAAHRGVRHGAARRSSRSHSGASSRDRPDAAGRS